MRRIVGSLMVLALALGLGCSNSDQTSGGATIQSRPMPAIWADILTQRDLMQAAVSKGTDMWHEDCAQVSAAAAEIDKLAVELNQRVAEEASVADRRKGIENLIGYLQSAASTQRTAAIDEVIGSMPGVMIGIDALLQGLEKHFTRDEIGSESVVTRPGFNPVHPPPPPSPV